MIYQIFEKTFIFILLLFHIYKNLIFLNYFYKINIWFTGIIIIFIIIILLFLGYILTWGQISYWGATVITKLINNPEIIKIFIGNYNINLYTIKRFFIIHFILSIIINFIKILHLYYIHYINTVILFLHIINNWYFKSIIIISYI